MKRILSLLLALVSPLAFAATLYPIQLLSPAGSTSGQTIVSTGASSAPGWGTVPAGDLSPIAANTVLANATGSTATPTAVPMPNCVGTSSALNYTSGSSYTCNASINALTLGGATFSSPGPIGSTAAAAGSFTTLSSTGNFAPSQTNGIVGTTTNNNANAGSVGEYLSATTASTSLTTATPTNCASEPLTAGDYDVESIITYTPGASETISGLVTGVNTTSATFAALGSFVQANFTVTAANPQTYASPVYRVSLASSGTLYAVGQASFTGSTMTCAGFIRARRVR